MNAQSSMQAKVSSLKIDPELRGEPRKHGLRWLVGILLVLAVAFSVWAWLRPRTVPVNIARVQPLAADRSLTVLSASGYVTPRRRATIAAKVTGQVKALYVDEGMTVAAGQVLARLDDANATARLAAAKAELAVAEAAVREVSVRLDLARKNRERIASLFEADMASREQMDAADNEVDALTASLHVARKRTVSAKRSVAVAEQDVDNHVIRAPFAGIAVSKDAQVGEMVSPVSAGGGFTRTGIATIVDMDSLEIEVDVNEAYIARVTAGQPVIATLDAYPDWHIPAYVRTVIPTADRQKATVKVRITFDRLDPRILPDMGVKVAFQDQQNHTRASGGVLVPASAVVSRNGKTVVFVVRDDHVERRAVRVSRTTPEGVVVTAGLHGSDTVVVDVPASLADGTPIRITTN